MADSCGTCRYVAPCPDDAAAKICRKGPPVVASAEVNFCSSMGIWPIVKTAWWCGEWAAAT